MGLCGCKTSERPAAKKSSESTSEPIKDLWSARIFSRAGRGNLPYTTETLTPAFSKTFPSCSTHEMPPPPLGRDQVSVLNCCPSILPSSSIIFCWCCLMSFSIRNRIGEDSLIFDDCFRASSTSTMDGASSSVTSSVIWNNEQIDLLLF